MGSSQPVSNYGLSAGMGWQVSLEAVLLQKTRFAWMKQGLFLKFNITPFADLSIKSRVQYSTTDCRGISLVE
jgi:hypothetical protein